MKVCFKCSQAKPLVDFYRHAMMADGYLNKCKVCTRSDVHRDRHKDIEKTRATARARRHGKNRKTILAKDKVRNDRRRKDPSKQQMLRAHSAVNHAVRDGKLFRQPCEKCGNHKAQGHHDDYSKPLEVVWLCTVHHAERHMELKRTRRAVE